MMRQSLTLGLLAAVLATAGGCCFFNRPAVRYRNSDCGGCGECDDCAVVRPGIVGRMAANHEARACRRGYGCGQCDACAEPCGEAVCPPYDGPHCGPLSFFFAMRHVSTVAASGGPKTLAPRMRPVPESTFK